MMHHGNCHEHCGCGQHQVQPIVCPTQYRCHDEFTQREVPFIHPIVNVTRHNIVDVPVHYYTETNEDVMGATISPQGGCGSQFGGGFGPEFGGPGRPSWM